MCYCKQINPPHCDGEKEIAIEGICAGILLVNDDVSYENSVSKVLRAPQYCNYTHHPSFTFRVVRTKSVDDALREICENKEGLDLVITNLHKLDTLGSKAAIQTINQKFNISLIPSEERIEVQEAELHSFSVYFVNGLNLNGLKNLLGHAKDHKIMGAAAAAAAAANIDHQQQNTSTTTGSININTNVDDRASSSAAAFAPINAATADVVTINTAVEHVERELLPHPNPNHNPNPAAVVETYEAYPSPSPSPSPYPYPYPSPHSPSPSQKGKRPRVSWTGDMHNKFLKAIQILGDDNAVPKKIMEVMGVQGLTRENVASHLQKHRHDPNLQRFFKSKSSRSTRIHWNAAAEGGGGGGGGLTTNTSQEPAAGFVPPIQNPQQSAPMLDPLYPAISSPWSAPTASGFPQQLLGATGDHNNVFLHDDDDDYDHSFAQQHHHPYTSFSSYFTCPN